MVYFERFASIREAIRREKQIKGGVRVKKVTVIEAVNPKWIDFAEDHYRSAMTFERLSC